MKPRANAKPDCEETPQSRFEDYLKQGEAAAMYLSGLADAMEAGGSTAKEMICHLRHHAHELNMGTMWVRHGYRDAPPRGE